MNRFYLGAIAAAVGLLACQGDPTASLRGGPFLITATPDLMFVSEGEDRSVVASVEDEQLNPLALDLTATSGNPAVFTVVRDTLPVTNNARTRFIVTALVPGQATLTIQGGGLSKTATVNVMPLAFTGAASTATPQVGRELTFQSTSVLKFGSTSNVDFGGGILGVVTQQTADLLTVRVPQPDAGQPGTLTVDSIVVTYVAGLRVSLPTATTFDVQNPYGNNSAPDPADPDANIAITAGGAPIVLYDGFTSTQADNFYVLNVTGTATFTVQLDWDTGADLDILYCVGGCSAGADFVGNFDGATGDNPEVSTVTLAAGSYNLYINAFDNHDEPSHLYRITITPQ